MPSAFRSLTVKTTLTIIASYNPNRKLIMIANESEFNVYVSKDPSNIAEEGLILYPYEVLVFDVADADRPEEAFYGVAEGDAKVRVYEALV